MDPLGFTRGYTLKPHLRHPILPLPRPLLHTIRFHKSGTKPCINFHQHNLDDCSLISAKAIIRFLTATNNERKKGNALASANSLPMQLFGPLEKVHILFASSRYWSRGTSHRAGSKVFGVGKISSWRLMR